ncbi:MAG: FAD-binding oxidoreductase [Rhodospirillales bacterium]|nr:MAG: FAD-binding oxidoreductase [Rhodospirillales bacterium]
MPRPARDVRHPDFREEPYWWEAFRPARVEAAAPPRRTEVAIVGGGYAGLSTARALADRGVASVVFEAGGFGSGASTRSGGALSAGLSVGKSFTGRSLDYAPDLVRSVVGWGIDAYRFLVDLVAAEGIDCHFERRGRFLGACAASHYDGLRKRHDKLRAGGATDCRLITRAEQRAEIGSDFYHGGMVFEDAGKLHPALFYGGLLAACRRRDAITLAGGCAVTALARGAAGWRLTTATGEVEARHVVIATNGYTGALTPELRRRVVPVASHIIATEELPDGLALKLCPRGRTFSETRRVLHYYRLSPDGRRVIFGGRSRFTEISAELRARLLHAAMVERFPELADIRVTHAWQGNVAFTYDALPHAGELDGLHFVLGCNGSGVSMMPFLGDALGRRLAGALDGTMPFDVAPLPRIPLYNGSPWFMPVVGGAFRLLDHIDERIR